MEKEVPNLDNATNVASEMRDSLMAMISEQGSAALFILQHLKDSAQGLIGHLTHSLTFSGHIIVLRAVMEPFPESLGMRQARARCTN